MRVIVFYILVVASAREQSLNDEQKLLQFIMKEYDLSVRPVYNSSTVVVVEVGVTLSQIFNINEKKQTLSMNIWLEQGWRDERLQWNPSEFGNITQLTVPTRLIWTPDIVLLNNAEDFSREVAQTNVNAYPDGSILWAPPIKSHSTCQLDVALFPFDQQVCYLRYSSWIYDATQVDVTNRSHKINIDESNYIENGEWHVVSTEARRNVRKHPYYDVQYGDVTFTLHLRRRVLYYVYNIIVPCLMLSVLTLLQFWLPCESGEKVTLGLTVLLAYSVFSFNISEKLPETSDVIPLIAIFITCIMGISCVSVIFSVIVLTIRYGDEYSTPPNWLKYLTGNILAPLLCRTWSAEQGGRSEAEDRFRQALTASLIGSSDGDDRRTRVVAEAKPMPVVDNNASSSSDQLMRNILSRTRTLASRFADDLKDEQAMQQWRQIATIFDAFFFWIAATITLAWALFMVAVAPTFSYRPF